jgi:hypothetical protein
MRRYDILNLNNWNKNSKSLEYSWKLNRRLINLPPKYKSYPNNPKDTILDSLIIEN